jgi:hypothetical protein
LDTTASLKRYRMFDVLRICHALGLGHFAVALA